MQNDRPVDNPQLEAARKELFAVYAKYGFAGAFEIISPDEAAYGYPIYADWSAIQHDPSTPMGIRLKAKSGEDGVESRVEGAAHTLCQLMDFGAQTYKWCGDLIKIFQQAGIHIEHEAFSGQELGDITGLDQRKNSE